MAKRRPNIRAIKIHRNYTVEEAARVLGVAKGTVRRWLKMGLEAINDRKPILILGEELKRFFDAQSKKKQKCALDEFFCFRCKQPKQAAGGMIDYLPRNDRSGQLSAICITCEGIVHKAFSGSKLATLANCPGVSIHQAPTRLMDMNKPRSNDHFGKGVKP